MGRLTSSVLALLIGLGAGCAKESVDPNVPTEEVKRAAFVIRVSERCELKAENARKIICPRFRRWHPLKITKLVGEGTQVKEGDFLASLDKTELTRRERDLKADVRRATAEVERLKKSLIIERDKLNAELERRGADLRIKELDVTYLKDLPTSVSETEASVELRKAELDATFAREEFEPVQELAKLGFQSQAQFSEKKLAADQAVIEKKAKELSYADTMSGADRLDLAKAELDLREARLRYEQSKFELDYRVRQAQKALEAAEWDLKREDLELKRFQESIKQVDFYAPKAGVVVYMKVFQGSAKEKIKEGVSVRPRTHMMSIEDMSTMIAKAQVEEAQIRMVQVKQKAKIRLDAVQDETFSGEVIEVGTIAREKGDTSSGDWWRGKGGREDSGIRVFDVKIRLDGTHARLRSGMAGNTEIMVEEIPDAISIPVSAVFKADDGSSYVYVERGGRATKTPVQVGRAADGRVVVTKGLAGGEAVCLSEPEG